ncbi:MAG TPA: zonular occludens toxin domain-containing protein [Streptosporangiaceae bacterium]
MIALVVGPPGSGKSYTSVALIVEAVREGRYIATNIELAEAWAEDVARTYPLSWLRGRGWRARKAAELRRLVFVSADLDELFRVRLAPCGDCRGCRAGRTCRREGRGRMVLDEAHNWMNARTWDSDPSGKSDSKGAAVARRLAVVRFFSQHRKLGWEVFLITQDEANVDRQVRSLFEYLIRLRNLRNFKVAGVRLIPFNLFLAIWGWNDPSHSVAKRQVRRLSRRIAGLYDTMALSHGLDVDDESDVIWLPHPPVDVAEQLREVPAGARPKAGAAGSLHLAAAPSDEPPDAPASPAAAAGDLRAEAQPESTSQDGRDRRQASVFAVVRPHQPARSPSVPEVAAPTTTKRPGGHPGASDDPRQAGRDRAGRG